MKDLHLNLAQRFNSLNLRERVLVSGTLLAITWALWISSIGGDVIDTRAVVVTDLDRVEIELRRQQMARARLGNNAGAKVTELGAQRTQLVAELDYAEGELQAALDRFVAPEEISGLLEDVIAGHEKLQLVRIATQPAESLEFGPESTLRVYRHPVQVELQGSYMDLIAYLDDLEASGWGLSWRRLEYVVVEYPLAQVLIEIETLSREEDWLGV